MNLGKIFSIFSKKEKLNTPNEIKETEVIDYDQLIKKMKLAKKMNDTVRQEIFQKADDFEKSMKELKKKSRK